MDFACTSSSTLALRLTPILDLIPVFISSFISVISLKNLTINNNQKIIRICIDFFLTSLSLAFIINLQIRN